MPEHTSGQKATGKLLYHDLLFDRNPCGMILNIYALEEGSMRISFCAQGMETKSLTIQIREGRAFEDISMSFPSGFQVPEEPCTLKIETEGKIKLCRFFFR